MKATNHGFAVVFKIIISHYIGSKANILRKPSQLSQFSPIATHPAKPGEMISSCVLTVWRRKNTREITPTLQVGLRITNMNTGYKRWTFKETEQSDSNSLFIRLVYESQLSYKRNIKSQEIDWSFSHRFNYVTIIIFFQKDCTLITKFIFRLWYKIYIRAMILNVGAKPISTLVLKLANSDPIIYHELKFNNQLIRFLLKMYGYQNLPNS